MIGHRVMGMSLLHTGDIAESRTHYNQAIELYEAPGLPKLLRDDQPAITPVASNLRGAPRQAGGASRRKAPAVL